MMMTPIPSPGRTLVSTAACLFAVGCGAAPTGPEPSADGPFVGSQPATLAASGGKGGGKPAPAYVTHPLRVTFADREGDAYASDGGGPYTDEIDGTWVITDYADPTRPDHFQFISGPGVDRLTRLVVPGVVPPTDCAYFRFSVRDVDAPDLYATPEGWTGTGSGTLQCEEGRSAYHLEVGECVSMAHDAGSRWSVIADGCPAEISSGSGRKAQLLGTFPVSFAFDAIEP